MAAAILRGAGIGIFFLLCGVPGHAREREPVVLRVAVPAPPAQFDPHKASSAVDLAVASEIFMGLVARDAEGALIPGAATHWEVSPDGLTYKFHLRPDLKWSDGSTVRADDFVEGLVRALDPATAAPFAGDLLAIKGATEFHSGLEPVRVLGLSTPNSRTVAIELARPSVRFLHNLSRPVAAPIPQRRVAKLGQAWASPQNLISNGAFTIESGEGGVALIKSPHFFAPTEVAPERVVFTPAPTADDAAKLVRDGDAHLSVGFSFQGAASRSNPRGLKAEPGQNLYFVAVNMRSKPLRQREARHALAMAIDREGILKLLRLSNAVPAYGMVAPAAYGGVIGSRAPYAPLPQEVRGSIAEVLLEEFKISAATPVALTLMYAKGAVPAAVAKSVAAVWTKLGVRLSVEEKSAADYEQSLRTGAFDFALATWPARDSDPASFLTPLTSTGGPWNAGGYTDADFDRRVVDGDTEIDPAQRPITMAGAEVILIQDQAVMPLFFYTPLSAVSSGVDGWHANASGTHPLRLLSP